MIEKWRRQTLNLSMWLKIKESTPFEKDKMAWHLMKDALLLLFVKSSFVVQEGERRCSGINVSPLKSASLFGKHDGVE